MNKWIIVTAILVLASMVSAQTVAGRVYNQLSMSPRGTGLSDARVVLVANTPATRPLSAISGVDGAYRIANVPAGSYAVTATLRGWVQTTRVTANVRPNPAGTVITVNVPMAPVRRSPIRPGADS